MDRDTSAIGGLRHPLQPTRQLFYFTIAMDILAVAICAFIQVELAVGILLYILASRAYSYRGIRLKQYPVLGFLTVFMFQGALVYLLTSHAIDTNHKFQWPLLPALTSSTLIGALYPLTQIYQHQDDKADGVVTISMLLGKTGTFVFSAVLFLAATCCIYVVVRDVSIQQFYYFLLIMLPVVLFFLRWMTWVLKDPQTANFTNSLRMNVLATACTTIYFLLIFILNH